MARYDYQCEDCNAIFEVSLSIKDKDEKKPVECTGCKSTKTFQLFNSIAVLGGGASSPGLSSGGSGCTACSMPNSSCSSCG